MGHFYSVLRVPEGASVSAVQEAYEALERHWAPWIELEGERGEQARAELAAARYAYHQIQSLKATGSVSVVPDVPAADKARAGCLLPIGALLLVLTFLWWPRSDQAVVEPLTTATPEVEVAETVAQPVTQEQEVAAAPSDESDFWSADSQPTVPGSAEDIALENTGQETTDVEPLTAPEPATTPAAEVETPVTQTDPAPPVPESMPQDNGVGIVGQEAVGLSPPSADSEPPISPSTEVASTPAKTESKKIPETKAETTPSSQANASEITVSSSLASGSFGLGATQAQVKAVMGTPSAQIGNTWQYEYDSVRFEGGRVAGYSNISGDLKIAISPKVRSSKTHFSLGDTQDVVLSVMGTPSAQIGNTWQYEYDSVRFEDGRVASYSNISGDLKIKLAPQTQSTKSTFTLGDTQDVVLSVMGTPSAQIGNTWQYEYDSVRFEGGRVAGYSNISGDLKIAISPKIRSSKTHFSLGDTQDVVLSVMGTPSAQIGNTWQYEYDSVRFEDGRVASYSNISGDLLIR